ncbi:MAG: hypothetical protein WD009_14690 [Phycisphaeraceae bacterium]
MHATPWMKIGLLLSAAALLAARAPANPPLYTPDNAPDTPSLDQLERRDRISQHGITWTFDRPVPIGQFVNGDYYVIGPVTVVEIDPAPANGRNGSTLNIPVDPTTAESKLGFDDRIPFGRYAPDLFHAPPIEMKPGDALVSSISLGEDVTSIQTQPRRPRSEVTPIPTMLWDETWVHSPMRVAAVLTCLGEPVPADAFRPGYADRSQRVYLARNLRRDRLPALERVAATPSLDAWQAMFERPWLDVVMDEFGAPIGNMPRYGREFTRATSIATLLLALDFPEAQKQPLLIGLCQVGIDLRGLLDAGKPGWPPLGGHGNGRKWTIIFTGLMLDEPEMQQPLEHFPHAVFSEDRQTMFDDGWTGAQAVYAGHVGPAGHDRHEGWGRYEHLPPEQWVASLGESYRRCCTSKSWVGTALAVQLYEAEELWDHDAFLVYADRWMNEDDSEHVERIRDAGRGDWNASWQRQGALWDEFVGQMWLAYRPTIKAPVERWRWPGGVAPQ